MVSDFILSLVAFHVYFQLRDYNNKWRLFFLFIALSAFTGAIYHGFFETFEPLRFLAWGLFSMALVFAQLAAYQYSNNSLVKSLFIIKSFLLLGLAIQYLSFNFLVADTILSLFGFVVLGNLFFLKSLSAYISYGILVSFTSVFVVVFDINMHPEYLTQNDIGHYITALSLVIMSKGVREGALTLNLEVEKI